jgi:hypothetical protein
VSRVVGVVAWLIFARVTVEPWVILAAIEIFLIHGGPAFIFIFPTIRPLARIVVGVGIAIFVKEVTHGRTPKRGKRQVTKYSIEQV